MNNFKCIIKTMMTVAAFTCFNLQAVYPPFSTIKLSKTGSPVTNMVFDQCGRFLAVKYQSGLTHLRDLLWLDYVHKESSTDTITSLLINDYGVLEVNFDNKKKLNFNVNPVDQSNVRKIKYDQQKQAEFCYDGIKTIITTARVGIGKNTQSHVYVNSSQSFYVIMSDIKREIQIYDNAFQMTTLVNLDENPCLILIAPEIKIVAVGFRDGSVVIYKSILF